MARKGGDNSYLSTQTGRPKTYVLYFRGIEEQLVFPIPPSQVSYVFPERVTPSQTLNGIWADDFGEGIIGIAISGSFGWGVSPQSSLTGKMTMAKLTTMWRARAQHVVDSDPDQYRIRFIDNQRSCVYECISPEFHQDMNQQSPEIIRYQMTFQVLETVSLFGGISGSIPSYVPNVNFPIPQTVNPPPVPAVTPGGAPATSPTALNLTPTGDSPAPAPSLVTVPANVSPEVKPEPQPQPNPDPSQKPAPSPAPDPNPGGQPGTGGPIPAPVPLPPVYDPFPGPIKLPPQTGPTYPIGSNIPIYDHPPVNAPPLPNPPLDPGSLGGGIKIPPGITTPPPVIYTPGFGFASQASSSAIARTAYGSSNPAYTNAISTSNNLSLGPTNVPLQTGTLSLPARTSITHAPFDGTVGG